jgi:coatomer subunit epsilon
VRSQLFSVCLPLSLQSNALHCPHDELTSVYGPAKRRTALIVYIYLSIHRPDLARKEFERAKAWAEDDLLLQAIETSVAMVTGRDAYADAQSFFSEQIANPSVSAPRLLGARGVARAMRGEVAEARSDLEEALARMQGASEGASVEGEVLAATVVAAGLGPRKLDVAEPWRCVFGTALAATLCR